MQSQTNSAKYSYKEEIANSFTHGLGIVLSIVGIAILLVSSVRSGDAWRIVSSVIFGTTLLLLYTFSTLYHSIQRPHVKTIMRTLDHSAIFLLIAGSYTPFTLVNLRGPWGWSLFAAVWILAVLGILLQFTVLKKWRGITIGIYIFMGWAVVIAIKQMLATVAPMGMILLLAGGLSYTFGVVFYLWKKLPYNHAVWHLFVLAGSTLHFLAVLLYAVPLV